MRLHVSCSNCGERWPEKVKLCKSCASRIEWPETVTCVYDKPEGSGKCGVCKGTGKNPHYDPSQRQLFGLEKSDAAKEECPNCRGSSKCPRCEGKGKFALPGYF